MTLKTQMAADVLGIFMDTDEFAETGTYTSPAGVITTGVKVVAAIQSFIQEQEMTNTAGLGATIVIPRATVSVVEIHGKITITAGAFIINQIISKDDDTYTVAALGDTRISPAGMRA